MQEKFEVPDLSRISDAEGEQLCARLRQSLIQSVSHTGGHLASNLGAVELTVALHRVFDTSRDRLVFDVGHQCYCHKMLTGRWPELGTIRTFGGLSGFPKPKESCHDAFIAGHASNAVSVATGMARARTVLGEDYHVIALLGDGALTGGLAYEGLSDAGQSGEPLLVILNDNGMSITRNVGGVAEHLAQQRLKPQYLRLKKAYRKVTSVIPGGKGLYRFTHKVKAAVKGTLLPCSMFEDMGFTYIGPVDGHDLKRLTELLRWIRELPGPVLLHVRTVKGKGYAYAEQQPNKFHGVGPFDVETGRPSAPGGTNFSAVFGQTMCSLAQQDKRICAVTAAMEEGTGLSGFARQFPERFFDVGIAEEHAVAMCAGMAKQGLVPVFAVYSTFLQRAYDMLIHDVAMQGLHVILGVDRAGLVGEDGETHQGVFDLAMLATVPGMTVFAPSSFAELEAMLRQGVEELDGPVAIRYPRGGECGYQDDNSDQPTTVLRAGSALTLVSYGVMIGEAIRAADSLAQQGIQVELIKFNRLQPLEEQPILDSVKKTGRLITVEDVVSEGSMGARLTERLAAHGLAPSITRMDLGMEYIPHGTVTQLRELCGIDAAHIAARAREALNIG